MYTHFEKTFKFMATSETLHSGPNIPGIIGEEIFKIPGTEIGITTTIFSTWIFMIVFFVVIAIFYSAIKSKKSSKIKTF